MIYVDFETRSKCIIQKTGAWRYAADPSTDVLCMAYAIDDGPVELWVPGEAFPFSSKSFNGHQFEAHHSFFERAIWKNVMVKKYRWPEMPDDKWMCSASLACYHALPRSLADAGAALKLNHQNQCGRTVNDLSTIITTGRLEAQQRYDGLSRANKYQQEEHERIVKALEELTHSVQSFRCQSPTGK